MAGQVSVGSDKQSLLAPSILSADPLKIGKKLIRYRDYTIFCM